MSKTVLIVEDDAVVAEMLRDVLESEGFDVLVEADGEWALRTFENKWVDLVLVDVLVPKVQGFELIGRLRQTTRGKVVPVVVVSGVYRAQTYKAEMIEKHGIIDYLDKPVDLDRLIDVLHDVFSSAYPEPKSDTHEVQRPVLPELRVPAPAPDVVPLDAEVPEKGDLAEVPFATLLGRLYRARASGALMLRKSSVKKIVYLTEGIPVFVKSNLLSECLGRIMVQERLISQEECDESLERKKSEKKQQGRILVEMGSISQHNLEFALELQMQIKLYDPFSWLEGRYQFTPQAGYSGTQVALAMAPTAMIYEGANRAMSSDRIARELAAISAEKIAPSGDPTFRYQALQLDPRAAGLLDRIDGTRTVGELLDTADFDRADAALLIYALYCSGLLRLVRTVAGARTAPAPADVEEPEEAAAEPISLDESDVEVLSTGEINAIAELAKVHGEASLPEASLEEVMQGNVQWGELEALKDASADEVLGMVPARDKWSEPQPLLFPEDEDSLPEPLEGATEEAFTTDEPIPEPVVHEEVDTFQSDPPPVEPSKQRSPPRASSLPRSPRWSPKRAPIAEHPVAEEADGAPQLSDVIRRQVRARLEAQMAKLTSERPRAASPTTKRFPTKPSATSTYRVRAHVDRDPAKEQKLEAELTARLEELSGLSYYALLDVSEDAPVEVIRTAYHALARKHDPERVVGNTASRSARKKAEQIYLLLTRALSTLTNEAARAQYDKRIGLVEERRATLIAADSAFELGLEAAGRSDWSAAAELFARAEALNPEEGTYLAHRAWALHQGAPADRAALEQAIALLEQAAEKSPRTEEVWLFLGSIQQTAERTEEAINAYQRAVVCNPDCVRALDALRELAPPAERKSGLLSRLRT